MSKPMKLEKHERDSALWGKLMTHYSSRIAALRVRIENPTISEKERIELAWRIHEIKYLLALGEDEKNVAGAG